MLIEMADMREANRSYEANLQMIKQVSDDLNDNRSAEELMLSKRCRPSLSDERSLGGRRLDAVPGFAPARDASGRPGLRGVLAQVAADAIGTLKPARPRRSPIQGKVSVQKVVEAVMSAERTLQTAVAVRDKVVAAYQEVSRMAI